MLCAVAAQYDEQFRQILLTVDDQLHPSVMIFINDTAISRSAPPGIRDGDVITLIAPMAGG